MKTAVKSDEKLLFTCILYASQLDHDSFIVQSLDFKAFSRSRKIEWLSWL